MYLSDLLDKPFHCLTHLVFVIYPSANLLAKVFYLGADLLTEVIF
jgi:hypothetical protein